MKNNSLMLLFFLLIGLLLGGIIGELLSDIIPFLNYSKTIGVDTFIVDLSVLKLTLGFKMSLNLASVVGIIFSLILYSKYR